MRIEMWVGVSVACLMLGAGTPSADQAQQSDPSTLPANLQLDVHLARALQRVHDRSPTFRAQCERIARAAPHLTVRVRIDVVIPSWCRAFTVITRRGGRIRAVVHLPPSNDLPELAAHEFEHVLEQIEGLDLRRLALVRGSGVRTVAQELFETDRAQAAGRVVAGEMASPPRAPAAD